MARSSYSRYICGMASDVTQDEIAHRWILSRLSGHLPLRLQTKSGYL
jgi:hypothetical protein